MTARFATTEEVLDWSSHILANPDSGNVFQGMEFAEQKHAAGWTTRHIVTKNVAITVLEKRLPLLGRVWYAPKGPGVHTTEELEELLPDLRQFARQQKVFTMKIEPELPRSEQATLGELGLVPTRPIQPNNNTVLIDLAPSEDDILKALNQKGRHAIRRAERDGVTVKQVPATDETCRVMYDLLKDTANSAKFGIRAYDYYHSFWQRYEAAGLGQLFFAYFDGQVVAGAYAMVFGTKSTYKDGASVRERTAYGASHLLQWHVIQWAKAHGSLTHDLCGAPSIEESKDSSHPYYGIGRFKTSFNKTITEYVGAYQIPVAPLRSKLWSRWLEKVVRKLYYQRHGESYY